MRWLEKRAIIALALVSMAGTLSAEQVRYDSHGRRNPFLPPMAATPAPVKTSGAGPEVTSESVDTSHLEEWFSGRLTGIVWNTQAPYAIIGDDIVTRGEMVNGCEIVAIKPEGITLQYKKKRFDVTIVEELGEGIKLE